MATMVLCLLYVIIIAVPSHCEGFKDLEVLLEFKKVVTSDPNGHLRSWNEANPLCNWTGVTCHKLLENRIVSLRLEDKSLEGNLSPFLSNLSLLTTLSLHTNSFSGEIPSSLGLLSELVHLNLSNNDFRGEIPGSLEGCQSLKFLDLSENKLTGFVPEELGKIKSLTYLALSVNRLNGSIPVFLSNLTELTRLELGPNSLTGRIPIELGRLKKLEIMYIHTNYLEGSIPSSLSNCTALREISLSLNSFTGEIPSELGSKLRNLEKFYATINGFSGKIPVTLSNLSKLTLLDLSRNKLVGEVPSEFGNLKNLEILYLHTNLFDYSSLDFLTPLRNCSHLKKLHLASCYFAGKIPDSVGGLSQDLFYFNLLNNRITGDLPQSIGNLSGLVNLNLYYNFLNGKIPLQLQNLNQLQILNLARNKIRGPIPEDFASMHNLGLLDLSNNSINGPIPKSLCKAPQLRYIYLSHNRLSGTIPIELTNCSLLLSLDLAHNDLRGSIPPQIGDFPNIAIALNLSNNGFEGNLPENIGNLKSIEAIDFSKNNLSGTIPISIGNCIALEYLNLSHNALQGQIPESLGKIEDLQTLDLAHNELFGKVPKLIIAAKGNKIKSLNLSHNSKLCGGSSRIPLPPCESSQPRKGKRNKKLIVLYGVSAIIFVCVVILVIVTIVVWFIFLRKKLEEDDNGEEQLPSIPGRRIFTQRELEIATAGFDEARLLGTGSFGSVYKGTLDNTTFAVKVFHDDLGWSDKSLRREFKILSEIRHRNLVGLIGSAWNEEFKAIVLEYIPNGNLEQHLYPKEEEEEEEEESCELTMRERLSIAVDMANGLEYLQEGCPNRVVHCDVKPRNVLIDNDMVARLADFGIGKLFLDGPNEVPSSVSSRRVRGSVGYIAPEYGQGTEVSGKGDTYSFGVVLMEMVTRKRPTSEIFKDGLDIRKWAVSSLPSNVLDVVDSTLKKQASLGGSVGTLERLEKCCIEIMDVALACTEPKPQDRPSMSSVLPMLLHIWKDMGF